jgi:hypothetical protein
MDRCPYLSKAFPFISFRHYPPSRDPYFSSYSLIFPTLTQTFSQSHFTLTQTSLISKFKTPTLKIREKKPKQIERDDQT